MTQQADWIKEREAIRARVEAATPGSWNFDIDAETITASEWHNGEELTWPVADLPTLALGANDTARLATGEFIAHAPEDLRRLLAKSEEDERKLALREQRISELTNERDGALFVLIPEVPHHQGLVDAVQIVMHAFLANRLEIERLRKANEEVWEQAAKIADQYAAVNKAHAIIPMEIAARLREAARQSTREDESK